MCCLQGHHQHCPTCTRAHSCTHGFPFLRSIELIVNRGERGAFDIRVILLLLMMMMLLLLSVLVVWWW